MFDKAATDLTVENHPMPGPSKGKRPISMEVNDGIASNIARLDKRLTFLDALAQAFHCVICMSMSVAQVCDRLSLMC